MIFFRYFFQFYLSTSLVSVHLPVPPFPHHFLPTRAIQRPHWLTTLWFHVLHSIRSLLLRLTYIVHLIPFFSPILMPLLVHLFASISSASRKFFGPLNHKSLSHFFHSASSAFLFIFQYRSSSLLRVSAPVQFSFFFFRSLDEKTRGRLKKRIQREG